MVMTRWVALMLAGCLCLWPALSLGDGKTGPTIMNPGGEAAAGSHQPLAQSWSGQGRQILLAPFYLIAGKPDRVQVERVIVTLSFSDHPQDETMDWGRPQIRSAIYGMLKSMAAGDLSTRIAGLVRNHGTSSGAVAAKVSRTYVLLP
jgi:hypothetical protein